jgi:aspartate carbamoyltransferase regulatory subunit
MEENVTLVFHGFLNLSSKEKLKLIEEINNYFDSMNREPIREENENKFKQIDFNPPEKTCKCCGR